MITEDPKSDELRHIMREITGDGVLVTEGADHKRQRRLISSSLAAGAVNGMVSIFLDKAYDVTEKLLSMIEHGSIESSQDEAIDRTKIDISVLLEEYTLDVIGVAGLNYDTAAVSGPGTELADVYGKILSKILKHCKALRRCRFYGL